MAMGKQKEMPSPPKSVKAIVEYYYKWKKTDQYRKWKKQMKEKEMWSDIPDFHNDVCEVSSCFINEAYYHHHHHHHRGVNIICTLLLIMVDQICEDGGDLLCCDTCNLAYHLECIKMEEPPDFFSCYKCREVFTSPGEFAIAQAAVQREIRKVERMRAKRVAQRRRAGGKVVVTRATAAAACGGGGGGGASSSSQPSQPDFVFDSHPPQLWSPIREVANSVCGDDCSSSTISHGDASRKRHAAMSWDDDEGGGACHASVVTSPPLRTSPRRRPRTSPGLESDGNMETEDVKPELRRSPRKTVFMTTSTTTATTKPGPIDKVIGPNLFHFQSSR